MTTQLLAPEGYVLGGMLDALVRRKRADHGAADGYAKYQKISKRSARRMFVTPQEP